MTDDPLQGIAFRSMRGGINNRDDALTIADVEAADMKNFTTGFAGVVKTRGGSSQVADTITSATCWGLKNFNAPGDIQYLLAVMGVTMYRWDGASTQWEALTGATFSGSSFVSMAQIRDNAEDPDEYKVLCISPDADPVVFDGSSVLTSATLVPRGTDVLFWLNRSWISGNATMPSIMPSPGGEPLGTFDPAQGYQAGDGDPIQKSVVFMNRGIIVFMKHQIWYVAVDQTNIDGFVLDSTLINSITKEFGCWAPRSVVQVGEDFFFMSRWGVHRITKTQADRQIGVMDPVSSKIQGYIDRINWTYAENACAMLWDNQYVIAVPLDSSAVNNYLLSYDVQFDSWEVYDTWDAAIFEKSDVSGIDEPYFGNQTGSGKVIKAFDGTTDESAAIATELVTRRVDLGQDHVEKLFAYAEVKATGFDGGEIVVSAAKDGGAFNVVGTVLLDVDQPNLPIDLPFSLNDSTLVSKKIPLIALGHMNDVQLKLTSEESSQVEVLSITIAGYLNEESFV